MVDDWASIHRVISRNALRAVSPLDPENLVITVGSATIAAEITATSKGSDREEPGPIAQARLVAMASQAPERLDDLRSIGWRTEEIDAELRVYQSIEASRDELPGLVADESVALFRDALSLAPQRPEVVIGSDWRDVIAANLSTRVKSSHGTFYFPPSSSVYRKSFKELLPERERFKGKMAEILALRRQFQPHEACELDDPDLWKARLAQQLTVPYANVPYESVFRTLGGQSPAKDGVVVHRDGIEVDWSPVDLSDALTRALLDKDWMACLELISEARQLELETFGRIRTPKRNWVFAYTALMQAGPEELMIRALQEQQVAAKDFGHIMAISPISKYPRMHELRRHIRALLREHAALEDRESGKYEYPF